jgi:23S rRNA (uridine2552-2'-O)-methyltransferase
MPTRWYRELKSEGYYRKAKREGYRARSAYKLHQINSKYNIIKRGDVVIDLGAAPGGWSQVAVELGAKVIAVDIDILQPIDGVRIIQGDITEETTVKRILEEVKNANTVLSDMAPSLTGNYGMDQARSVWLAQNALKFAGQVLASGGGMVCKVFMGEEYPDFLTDVKRQFRIVRAFSPKASRKRSSETYVIAKNFTGFQ